MKKNRRFAHPKYWPVWLLVGFLWLLVKMPWGIQTTTANIIGFLLYHLAARRRKIVLKNLQLCFPEWDQPQRVKRAKEVFYHNALGLFEAVAAYTLPSTRFHARVDIYGEELLHKAKAQGRGVILLGAHYSHLDFGAALITLVTDLTVIYRPNNNPFIDHLILQGRQRILKAVIDRDNIRAVIKALRQQEVIWYPPDQDYGPNHSVYAPFFGVNAATIDVTTRLHRLSKAPVLMLSYRRDDDAGRYIMEFEPAPTGFPSSDKTLDATLINAALEANIRKAPTQYMWTHRRFKTQPEGKGLLYR